MGNDHSRSRDGQRSRSPSPSSHVANRLSDWAVVNTLLFDKWRPDALSSLGFDFANQWQARKLKVHKWPWSKFTVTGHNANGKEERLCSFSSEVVETGREEKIRVWMKDISVIAFQQDVLVVQVVQTKSIKLLVVNWRQGKLLGTYSFACMKEPCYQECFLSPDGSMMLCRQDVLLRRCLHHVTTVDAFIRVIQIKDGLCRRIFVIEDYLAMNILGSGISFDPCYPEGRVAIFSSTQQSFSHRSNTDGSNRLMIYDLRQRKVVASAPSQTDRLIHHMTHSPDGNTVAVLCVNVSVFLSIRTFLHSIDVYKTDTLSKTHSLPLFNELCKPNMLSMYPVFSRNGRLLAQFAGEQSRVVEVYKMPCLSSTLQEHCRSVILGCTSQSLICQLPLPTKLISFLKFLPKRPDVD